MLEPKQGENMKKILDVPFVSQNSDQVSEMWRDRSCGIANVKMILDFLSDETIPIQELIAEGLAIEGYNYSILGGSWKHEGLVRVLRNHGVLAYSQEFKAVKVIQEDEVKFEKSSYSKKFIEQGIEKIIEQLDRGFPAIVSVNEGFNNNKTSHLVLITGYEMKDNKILNLYYNDPDSRDGVERKNSLVEIDKFKEFWRLFCIFVDK